MDAKMEQLILDARRVKASDIHITEGMPVWYRVHGKLAKSQLQFSGEELRALLMGSMDERQKEIFASGRDVDFGLEISDGSRQRVNIFRQQHQVAAAIRLLNTEIPTLEQLRMPTRLYQMAQQPRGLILVTGPTGSGKTTLINLLMRFYDVNGGSIKVDGHDIRNFNRSNLREMFGMVLQDTWLFSGTIMENIRYGRLDATDEEVIAAAKAAHIHNFIMQQPGGYQMVLDEETSNVSQGQKQLLTIARAILADNKILILDEATSSVDTRTEMQIQKAMDNLMKGRTSFVIAHRLSTIKDADLILVMKDGDIIEQGDHEELLARKGFYADLYNSQFEQKQA